MQAPPAPARSPWDWSSIRLVVLIFLASRIALLAVGLMTQVYVRPFATKGNPLDLSSQAGVDLWGSWDTGWYIGLAREGYQALGPQTAAGQANWAFFPAYPGLSHILDVLTPFSTFQAMLVVSNLSFFFALLLVHRLARAEFDRPTADLAVVLLCVAPGSYIFSSGYTEALFLLAVTGALLLIRDRKWIAAGLVTALAVLTRNLGLGLLLPFAWMGGGRLWQLRPALRDAAALKAAAPEIMRMAIGAVAPLAALVGFCAHLYLRTGDALAFLHVQRAWGRSITNPLAAPLHGLLHSGSVPDSDLISLAAAWLALALLAVLALMRRWMLLSLALFLVLVPLAAGLASFARYTLVVVPIWLALAHLLARRPAASAATLAGMAMLNGFMMVAWTLTLWVTT